MLEASKDPSFNCEPMGRTVNYPARLVPKDWTGVGLAKATAQRKPLRSLNKPRTMQTTSEQIASRRHPTIIQDRRIESRSPPVVVLQEERGTLGGGSRHATARRRGPIFHRARAKAREHQAPTPKHLLEQGAVGRRPPPAHVDALLAQHANIRRRFSNLANTNESVRVVSTKVEIS